MLLLMLLWLWLLLVLRQLLQRRAIAHVWGMGMRVGRMLRLHACWLRIVERRVQRRGVVLR